MLLVVFSVNILLGIKQVSIPFTRYQSCYVYCIETKGNLFYNHDALRLLLYILKIMLWISFACYWLVCKYVYMRCIFLKKHT